MTRTFTATNTIEAIVAVIRDVSALVKAQGASRRAMFITDLVLEEVLTNIVKYGYKDEARHEIEVIAKVDSGQVVLEFRDDGRHFDPLQAPSPTFGEPVATQRLGGRGIHLVRRFVTDCSYQREDGRNILKIEYPLRAE
jgi:anti-sigma regulatory factor (Ser/Thr protein kinase)